MYILGIDTSCDDTSASVIGEDRVVLSNIINSQVKLHHPYGGVVPELASREHVRNIVPVVDEALSRAELAFHDLNGVAVTVGPGLTGSLLVGLYYAKAIAHINQIPLLAINHLEGHILSVLLEENAPEFPYLVLTVSGGHTSIFYVKAIGDYSLMGQTLDDAAGEAFDKVAKILGLGYPGGPVIESMAQTGRKDRIDFPRARLTPDSFDFSFSGLKTAVSLYVEKWQIGDNTDSDVTQADIAASFQEAVIDVLALKLIRAKEMTNCDSIVLAGGVACNKALRERMRSEAAISGVRFFYPKPEYCTDNGAMIALAGYYQYVNGKRADMSTDVKSRYPIGSTYQK